MKYLLKFTIISVFSLIVSSLTFVTPILAQAPSSIDGVEILVNPATPAPGQNISVNVESFNTDLNAAAIVWLVNGKSYAKGTGLVSIDLSAPPIGTTITILAIIMTVEGKEIKKTSLVRSGGVDIIWESAGYVPPFYRGKSSYAYQNTLKITAIPHLAGASGAELDPRTLLYKWTKNTKVVQDQSGYGKQTLTLQEKLPLSLDIEVEVGTRNGDQKGMASISLQPGDPSISYYEEDSLYGVLYNKSLQNKINLVNTEVTIRAVPYDFNTTLKNSPLAYTWSINNLERQDLSTNQSITLRTKGDSTGSSAISLEIRNLNDILQGAQNFLNVSFTKKIPTSQITF